MPLSLYYDLLSQPSRTVYIFLKANNIRFEEKEVDLTKGEHKTEQYLKVNPFGKVPVLDEFGFTLTESVAMVKYMMQVHCRPDHWYPSNAKKQARVEEFLRWYPSTIRSSCVDLFLELVLYPKLMGTTPDAGKVATYRSKISAVVDEFDTYFLAGQRFIGGEEVSIADLFGACELYQLYGCNEHELYEKRPAVKAWVDNVRQATNPHFDEACKKIRACHDAFVGGASSTKM